MMVYDFILFSTSGSPSYKTGFPQRTLGVYRIAHLLREEGYTVKVIDYLSMLLNNDESRETLKIYLSMHSKENTIFGFSSNFFFDFIKREKSSRKFVIVEVFEEFLEFLKEEVPACKIILGGWSNASQVIGKNKNIDHWLIGYAESCIQNEFKKIYNGEKLDKIIHINSDDWSVRDAKSPFVKEDWILPNETLPIEISRGCRFKCKFCSYHLIGRKSTDNYIRSPEAVLQELLYNYDNFATTNYYIMCDTFNESVDKLKIIKSAFDEFKNITGEQVRFGCYLRLDLLNAFPEQIGLLKDMGIKSAFFGIESLHGPSAKSIGKSLSRARVLKTLQKCKDAWDDASLFGSFIIGLPEETRETANEWCQLLYDNKVALTCWQVRPLYMRQKDHPYITSISEFDRNIEKYGYTEYKTNDNEWSLSWKNKHWNFEEALEFSNNWEKKFIENNSITTDGSWIAAAKLVGYSADELNQMYKNKFFE